jgi:hypothetical protein
MAITARILPAPILRRSTILTMRISRIAKNARPAENDNHG